MQCLPDSFNGHDSASLAKHHLVDSPEVAPSYLPAVHQVLGAEVMFLHVTELQLAGRLNLNILGFPLHFVINHLPAKMDSGSFIICFYCQLVCFAG